MRRFDRQGPNPGRGRWAVGRRERGCLKSSLGARILHDSAVQISAWWRFSECMDDGGRLPATMGYNRDYRHVLAQNPRAQGTVHYPTVLDSTRRKRGRWPCVCRARPQGPLDPGISRAQVTAVSPARRLIRVPYEAVSSPPVCLCIQDEALRPVPSWASALVGPLVRVDSGPPPEPPL